MNNTINQLKTVYSESETLDIVKAYRVATDLADTIVNGAEKLEEAYKLEREDARQRYEDFGCVANSNIIAQFWAGVIDAHNRWEIRPQALAYMRSQLVSAYLLGVMVGDGMSDDEYKKIQITFDRFDKSRQEALKRLTY